MVWAVSFTAERHSQSVHDLKDLDDGTRTRLVEIYKQAIAALELATKWQSHTSEFSGRIAAVPRKLQETKTELAGLPEKTDTIVPADVSLAQLEQILQQRETEVGELKKKLAALEDEPKRRADRRVEIPREIIQARGRLAEIEKEAVVPLGV